jgi:hypothetical protein
MKDEKVDFNDAGSVLKIAMNFGLIKSAFTGLDLAGKEALDKLTDEEIELISDTFNAYEITIVDKNIIKQDILDGLAIKEHIMNIIDRH